MRRNTVLKNVGNQRHAKQSGGHEHRSWDVYASDALTEYPDGSKAAECQLTRDIARLTGYGVVVVDNILELHFFGRFGELFLESFRADFLAPERPAFLALLRFAVETRGGPTRVPLPFFAGDIVIVVGRLQVAMF